MPALLEQSAVVRVDPLQVLERRERVGDAPEVALADRHHVEHVAVFRHLCLQRLSGRQRGQELLCLHRCAHLLHLGLDARGDCGVRIYGDCRVHDAPTVSCSSSRYLLTNL